MTPKPAVEHRRSRALELLGVFFAALVLSVVLVVPFLEFSKEATRHRLELEAVSTANGAAQLFFNHGGGFSEESSVSVEMRFSETPRTIVFPLPDAVYTGFRFDPLDRAGTVTVHRIRIIAPDGTVFREFSPSAFSPQNQVASVDVRGQAAAIVTSPDAFDPYVLLPIGPAFELKSKLGPSIREILAKWLPIAAGCAAVALGLALLPSSVRAGLRTRIGSLWASSGRRPQAAVAAAAAIAAVVSSHPVVFSGKSFVSPNFGPVALLYQRTDTIPGSRSREIAPVSGADVGALMWMHLPLTKIAHRAVFEDGEVPLWNRYNSTGAPLLGQSQSMLGDPVHMLLPFLFGGQAWAWDAKYIVAKWLFAFGLGLIVWRLTRHLGSALIVAAAADFIGLFVYRVHHPAIFSVCYSPWMLLCWIGAVQATGLRGAARWACGLVVATVTEMASGTAKEAYMLVVFLNGTGALMLLISRLPARERLRRFVVMSGAGAVLVLLSAPIWISFISALRSSFTVYDAPVARQVPGNLFAGLFDEVLYRPFYNGNVWFPSASFVFLLGVIGLLGHARRLFADRAVVALALGFAVPFALAFSVIPGSWIVRVPILANVNHVGNTFTCVALIPLAALAGCGFAAAARAAGGMRTLYALVFSFLVLGALLAPYLVALRAKPDTEFVRWDLAALVFASLGLVALLPRLAGSRPARLAPVILASAFAIVLTWRFGLHNRIAFPKFALNAPARADLYAKSEAVEAVLARPGPYRAAGIAENLLAGWPGVYRLEGFAGPEPLINRYYREMMDVSGIMMIWDWRYFIDLAQFEPNRPFYDFLNVRYFFQYNSDRGRTEKLLKPVIAADTDVYESETAWPRAFFTGSLLRYDQPRDLAALIYARPGRPFAAVQASQTDSPAASEAASAGSAIVPARDYRLTSNRTTFDVDAPGAGVIVLNEAWADGDFRVRVNDRPAEYFRVNHLFKGIRVDLPGSYHVEYEYWPRYTTLSFVLGGVGLALLLGAAAVLGRHRQDLPAEG